MIFLNIKFFWEQIVLFLINTLFNTIRRGENLDNLTFGMKKKIYSIKSF